jgi:hypothetical protein
VEVVRIIALNREFPILGQGSTGSLVVQGEGLDLLSPHAVLGQPLEAPTDRSADPTISTTNASSPQPAIR